MKTAFEEISLDQIRYSLVWEDWQVLDAALQIQKGDTVALITSAGCNVLHASMSSAKKVFAIDLNPEQNRLLRFKCYLIRNFSFEIWEALHGFKGAEAVEVAQHQIQKELPQEFRPF